MQDLRQRLLIVVIASYQVIIGAARDREGKGKGKREAPYLFIEVSDQDAENTGCASEIE
jgi:hypothetical protein